MRDKIETKEGYKIKNVQIYLPARNQQAVRDRGVMRNKISHPCK
jgi:hypothetical protein